MLLVLIAVAGCTDTQAIFDTTPEITYVGIERQFAQTGFGSREVQTSVSDGVVITLNFKDGDGDLGGAASGERDFIVRDIRPELPNAYPYSVTTGGTTITVTEFDNSSRLPDLASGERRPSVEGTIRFIVPNVEALPADTCLRAPTPATFRQKVVYEIYVIDRAGHRSNTIRTDTLNTLVVRCL